MQKFNKKWIINIPKNYLSVGGEIYRVKTRTDSVKNFDQKARRKCKIAVDFTCLDVCEVTLKIMAISQDKFPSKTSKVEAWHSSSTAEAD